MSIKNYLVIMFLVGVFTSCSEDFNQTEPISNGAKDLNELKVSSGFNWSTSKTVEISIVGLPTLANFEPVKSTLVLRGENHVFYTAYHAINENLTILVTVPTNEKLIRLKFGSIEQKVTIENDKVAFSFIPKLTDEN
ncbi:MAG: hypothetical protein ACOYMD_15190 [Paludibacter sp.]